MVEVKKKLWLIKVTREIEDTFVGHMRSDTRPTEQEVIEWLAQEHYIEDSPKYTKYEIAEVAT